MADKTPETDYDITPVNSQQRRILKYLNNLSFRRCLIGGVSERDVWDKIDELNELYCRALEAERARYDALLQEHGIDIIEEDEP